MIPHLPIATPGEEKKNTNAAPNMQQHFVFPFALSKHQTSPLRRAGAGGAGTAAPSCADAASPAGLRRRLLVPFFLNYFL